MWAAVLLGSLGCYLLKLAGMSVPRRVLDDPRVQRVAVVLPIGLLAALAAVQTFADGRHLTVDARVAGVAVALVAAWRRAPFLAVVGLAAATTALLRLLAS
jgi:Branched-chain amino acid transport protein (AzlD)